MPFCQKCGTEYKEGAEFCSKCGANLKNAKTIVPEEQTQYTNNPKSVKNKTNVTKPKKPIFKRWWFWLIAIIILIIIIVPKGGKSSQPASTPASNTASSSSSTSSQSKPAEKQRQITGKATNLGAGTFTGGKDIPVGLYDVTPVSGTGNFTVNSSSGDLLVNEVLGKSSGLGVLKVRVKISKDDKIQLQSINKTHFEPVATPFVKSVQKVKLYSGTWTVGEDIAAGRYKASTPSGAGNFVVYDNSGLPGTNEILGSGGVKEVIRTTI
jgi:hypothetical protein